MEMENVITIVVFKTSFNSSSSAVGEAGHYKFFVTVSLTYAGKILSFISQNFSFISFVFLWLLCEIMLMILMDMLKGSLQWCTAPLGGFAPLGKQ